MQPWFDSNLTDYYSRRYFVQSYSVQFANQFVWSYLCFWIGCVATVVHRIFGWHKRHHPNQGILQTPVVYLYWPGAKPLLVVTSWVMTFMEASLLRRAVWGVRFDTWFKRRLRRSAPVAGGCVVKRPVAGVRGTYSNKAFVFLRKLSFCHAPWHFYPALCLTWVRFFWLLLIVVGFRARHNRRTFWLGVLSILLNPVSVSPNMACVWFWESAGPYFVHLVDGAGGCT